MLAECPEYSGWRWVSLLGVLCISGKICRSAEIKIQFSCNLANYCQLQTTFQRKVSVCQRLQMENIQLNFNTQCDVNLPSNNYLILVRILIGVG